MIHKSSRNASLIVFLSLFGLTSCGQNSQVKILPSDIESICHDDFRDAEVPTGEEAFGQVQDFAEIKAVGLGTGKFDANSDRVILLASIEMLTWDNPVYLNTITHAGSFVTRSVVIGIQPDDNLLDGYQYSIVFEWTESQIEPNVKVTRSTNSTLDVTIYEPQVGFRDNQFWAAIPVTVLEGVTTGSHWFAFSLTNYFTDNPITTSSAMDKCEGGIF